MLFSEIYSVYYTALGKLIEEAINNKLTAKNAKEIIDSIAFSESFIYILDNIKSENWQVITKDFKTPIKHIPKPPLTLLEKRFLKAISLDPRFKLFYDDNFSELLDIEPLYFQKDFYYFDKISDGDPFNDPDYIKNFRIVLRGIKEHKRLQITFRGGKGLIRTGIFTPRKLEFSTKDDKFRLMCKGDYSLATINLARIKSVTLLTPFREESIAQYSRNERSITIEITDERNTLERVLLCFASLKKETKQLSKNLYEMKLSYYKDDETEILIRVLSFGRTIKVTAPNDFILLIKERLHNQKVVSQ